MRLCIASIAEGIAAISNELVVSAEEKAIAGFLKLGILRNGFTSAQDTELLVRETFQGQQEEYWDLTKLASDFIGTAENDEVDNEHQQQQQQHHHPHSPSNAQMNTAKRSHAALKAEFQAKINQVPSISRLILSSLTSVLPALESG